MKTFLLIILSTIFTLPLFAQNCDTTFYANLSSDFGRNKVSFRCRREEIKIKEEGNEYPQNIYIYKLTIDGKSIVDTLIWVDYCCNIEIIDINKTDNSKETLISGPGEEDESCYRVYNYSNGPKLLCKADYCGSFEPDGKGNIYAGHWMGFCTISDKYVLSDDAEKMNMVNMDFYPVKIDYYNVNPSTGDYETSNYAKVASSFELLSERNKESKIVAKTKPGDKIYVTGLDTKIIKTTEKDSDNEDVETQWIWIQMKTEDGITGWILMKEWDQEFWSKLISGVMFAA